MPEHSPEPWTSNVCAGFGGPTGILGSDHQPVIIGEDWTISNANMGRINACVNACKGIPTEALEAGVIDEFVWARLMGIGNRDCKPHSLFPEQVHKGATMMKKYGAEWEEFT